MKPQRSLGEQTRLRAHPTPGGVWVVEGRGRLDCRCRAPLAALMSQLLSAGAARVMFDCSRASYLGATVACVLHDAGQELGRRGGGLELVCAAPDVVAPLVLSGLMELFSFSADRAAARSRLAGSDPVGVAA